MPFADKSNKQCCQKDHIYSTIVQLQFIISRHTQTGSNGSDIGKRKFISAEQIYKIVFKSKRKQRHMGNDAGQPTVVRKNLHNKIDNQTAKHI